MSDGYWIFVTELTSKQQLGTALQLEDTANYTKALHADDGHIVSALKALVSSEHGRRAVLSLKDAEDKTKAEWMLNLIDFVSYKAHLSKYFSKSSLFFCE